MHAFKKATFGGLLQVYKTLLFSWDPFTQFSCYHQPISSLFLYPIPLTQNIFSLKEGAEGNRVLTYSFYTILVSMNTLGCQPWVMMNFSILDLNIKMWYISEIKMSTRSNSSVHSMLTISSIHLQLRITVSRSINIWLLNLDLINL